MRNNKRKNKILLLIVLLLGISLGYAALSTTLKIDGTTVVAGNTWSVYWDRNTINVKEGSKGSTTPTVTDDEEENTVLNWSTTLDLPGDFYEFTIDAVNDGTLDAMIENINSTVPADLVNYISCTVMYADRTAPDENHILKKQTRVKYRIRVEFLDTITNTQLKDIPDGGLSYEFSYEIKYSQADENAIQRPTFFGTATWDEILDQYDEDDPDDILLYNMREEALRNVNLDMDYDNESDLVAHLRIANLSEPSECSGENYSQTACGFVIEFADIIGVHRMNYYPTSGWFTAVGVGTRGGWEHSDVRAYLNGGTYSYENINYADNNILLSLPSDLRSIIIDTKVSSSDYSTAGSSTSLVTDKLYYLSPTELWGQYNDNSYLNYNLNSNKTRQLDYYNDVMRDISVCEPNYPDEICYPATSKKSAGEFEWSADKYPDFWGLREAYAYSSWDSSFYRVLDDGAISFTQSHYPYGVSPAFRIATKE